MIRNEPLKNDEGMPSVLDGTPGPQAALRPNPSVLNGTPGPRAALRSAPSDLELMLYADGELAEPRSTVVRAWLAREGGGRVTDLGSPGRVRAQIATARLGSRLLRERAARSTAPVGLADAIMAAIEADSAAIAVEVSPVVAEVSPAVLEAVEASPAAAQTVEASPPAIAQAAPKVAPLRLVRGDGAAPASDARPAIAIKRANDRRRIRRVAAFSTVLAAAAAFLVWFQLSPSPGPVAGGTTPSASPVARGEVASPTPSVLIEPPAEGDSEPSVEVAAVDFGALTGTIFYVPTGAAAHATTTVVWLNDEAGGK